VAVCGRGSLYARAADVAAFCPRSRPGTLKRLNDYVLGASLDWARLDCSIGFLERAMGIGLRVTDSRAELAMDPACAVVIGWTDSARVRSRRLESHQHASREVFPES
jgi:hypothetical protein